MLVSFLRRAIWLKSVTSYWNRKCVPQVVLALLPHCPSLSLHRILVSEKTSFFQALSISTKISKGKIEIINDVPILKPGDKVGASETTLLNMLNISPFSYGLIITQVYDSIFSPEILDIKPKDLRAKFQAGVANLAAVSLEIGYPAIASVPHSISNGFNNLLAIAAATEVDFKEAATIKEFIKDPSKFATAAAASAPAAGAGAAAEKKEEAKKEESESEEDDNMGFGLFD